MITWFLHTLFNPRLNKIHGLELFYDPRHFTRDTRLFTRDTRPATISQATRQDSIYTAIYNYFLCDYKWFIFLNLEFFLPFLVIFTAIHISPSSNAVKDFESHSFMIWWFIKLWWFINNFQNLSGKYAKWITDWKYAVYIYYCAASFVTVLLL